MGGKHLTQEARFYIEKRLADNISSSRIARKLGAHHATVSRKIKRNTEPDFKQLYFRPSAR